MFNSFIMVELQPLGLEGGCHIRDVEGRGQRSCSEGVSKPSSIYQSGEWLRKASGGPARLCTTHCVKLYFTSGGAAVTLNICCLTLPSSGTLQRKTTSPGTDTQCEQAGRNQQLLIKQLLHA